MRKAVLIWLFLLLSENRIYPQLFESIFTPEKYIVFRCSSPPLIDGAINDTQWESVNWSNSFVDIEGADKSVPQFETKVKMLWDSVYFYFAALLYDKQIWAKISESEDEVIEDNNFQIYIDPDGDAHEYMTLEINALGTYCDLFMDKPYRDGGEADIKWNFEGLKKAVKVYGKINNMTKKDSCWTFELAIPWKAMHKYSGTKNVPVDGEQWRMNFLRVHWKTYIKDYEYRKERGPDKKILPPVYWTWSPQYSLEINQPETWGYVQFSKMDAGTGIVGFIENPDEGNIWSLWQVYYLYQTYPLNYAKVEEDFLILKNKKYASNLDFKSIELGEKKDNYIARTRAISKQGYWYIRKDGKLWFEKDK